MIKGIKILLYISGTVTLLTFIYIVVGTRIGFNGIIPLAIIMFFLSDSAPSSSHFLYFFALFMFTPVLTATDFLCAHYVDGKNKVANRIASYRSLITCLLGVFSIFVGLFLFKPLHVGAKKIVIEGVFYLLFYGTLLALLMLSQRKSKTRRGKTENTEYEPQRPQRTQRNNEKLNFVS
jgi:hypothetical protein